MKTRTAVLLIGLALALGAAAGLGIALKFFGPDPQYWVDRAKYDTDVKERDQKLEAALGVIILGQETIAAKDKDLEARDARIRKLENQGNLAAGEQETLAAENAKLKQDAAAAIAANPAVRALVENYDKQLKAFDSLVFSLKATIDEERASKEDWRGKFDAMKVMYETAWAQYQDEHRLRLSSDGLRLKLEKQVNAGKFWKWAGLGGTVAAFAAGYFAHK